MNSLDALNVSARVCTEYTCCKNSNQEKLAAFVCVG